MPLDYADIRPGPGRAPLHGRAFYESLGSPKLILAPMVDQSEFAWRQLSRSYLPPAERPSLLSYTPMLHARLFASDEKYRAMHFEAPIDLPRMPSESNGSALPVSAPPCSSDSTSASTSASASASISASTSASTSTSASVAPSVTPSTSDTAPRGDSTKDSTAVWLDGNPRFDRPLFVQFCANDPDALLSAAQIVAPYCDAVDLNLGCPQGIARKGHYGSFLQEEPELIETMIRTLHENLPVPVTAKLRILETKEATLDYVQRVVRAGASIVAVHGRRREQKGHLTGVADWDIIRYLRQSLPHEVVLFANGNILGWEDLERCRRYTGVDGVMTAEGNLSNAAIFAPPPSLPSTLQPFDALVESMIEPWTLDSQFSVDTSVSLQQQYLTTREYWRGEFGGGDGWRVDGMMRRYLDILHRHLGSQKSPPRRKPLYVASDGDVHAYFDAAIRDERPIKHTRDEEDPRPAKRPCTDKSDGGADATEHVEKSGQNSLGKTDTNTNEKPDANANGSNDTNTNRPRPRPQPSKADRASLAASPNLVGVQPHLFHLLRHLVTRHTDIRDLLARSGRRGPHLRTRDDILAVFEAVLSQVERRVAQGIHEYHKTRGESWAHEAEELEQKRIAKMTGLAHGAVASAGAAENKTAEPVPSASVDSSSVNSSSANHSTVDSFTAGSSSAGSSVDSSVDYVSKARASDNEDPTSEDSINKPYLNGSTNGASNQNSPNAGTTSENTSREASAHGAVPSAAGISTSTDSVSVSVPAPQSALDIALQSSTASSESIVHACRRPWWVVQPIIRPTPLEALAKGSIKAGKTQTPS